MVFSYGAINLYVANTLDQNTHTHIGGDGYSNTILDSINKYINNNLVVTKDDISVTTGSENIILHNTTVVCKL